MFRSPGPNLVESDEGFCVQVLGRTSLLYREGAKSIHISSELLAGPGGIALFKESIQHWDPPDEDERIEEAERNRLLDNVRRAFAFKGTWIDVM